MAGTRTTIRYNKQGQQTSRSVSNKVGNTTVRHTTLRGGKVNVTRRTTVGKTTIVRH